ncbi:MAG: hypothetical protein FJ087_15380 [Deltaproteobacteria bacterium]|nr:hypothetical protein [Deltaproteobacteria bacterium]
MRFARALATIGVALFVHGCCGSMQTEPCPAKLGAPVPEKALDRVHAEIAARNDGKLYAGAAMVDITTDLARAKKGIYLGGFDMGRRNKGVRDPVYAHALYLDDGREPLVVVSLDVIGFMNDDVRLVRALASDRHREAIVIASTHDHVGPDTIGYWGPALGGYLPVCPGRVPEYMTLVRHLTARAIDEAAKSARPVRLRPGTGPVDPTLSLNIHPEIRKQKDDVVRVLAIEDAADGKPVAVLANWGCHAEAMWNDDQLSADWPGVFYRRWQAEVGGVPVFVEGALGGLVSPNPGDEKMAKAPEIMDVFLEHMSTAERVALMERVGNGFFDAVRAVVAGATRTYGPEGVTLKVASKRIELIQDNWVFDYMGKRRLIRRDATYRGGTTVLSSDIVAARIRAGGEVIADLATVPGEPTPPLVAEIDATSPAPVRFTVALGNDEVGYIVREADWDLAIYEYERQMSLGKPTGSVVLGAIKDLRSGL